MTTPCRDGARPDPVHGKERLRPDGRPSLGCSPEIGSPNAGTPKPGPSHRSGAAYNSLLHAADAPTGMISPGWRSRLGQDVRLHKDDDGNRTNQTVEGTITQSLAFNPGNQITSSGYGYDAAGNQTSSPTVTQMTHNGDTNLLGYTGALTAPPPTTSTSPIATTPPAKGASPSKTPFLDSPTRFTAISTPTPATTPSTTPTPRAGSPSAKPSGQHPLVSAALSPPPRLPPPTPLSELRLEASAKVLYCWARRGLDAESASPDR